MELDSTLVGTDGECERGIDMAYDGTVGYPVLVVTLAKTGEVLYLDTHVPHLRRKVRRRFPCIPSNLRMRCCTGVG